MNRFNPLSDASNPASPIQQAAAAIHHDPPCGTRQPYNQWPGLPTDHPDANFASSMHLADSLSRHLAYISQVPSSPPEATSACQNALPITDPRAAETDTAGVTGRTFQRLSTHDRQHLSKTAIFSGKTALITASTSSIGLGIARTLAAHGANIILHGAGDPSEIDRLCIRLSQQHDIRVRHIAANTSRPEEISDLMTKALSEFECIDLLINNAGIQHTAPVDKFPIESWYAVLANNLSATFHTVRLAVPAMKRRGFGRIVNVTSAQAIVASPHKSACVAAKHGIVGFTKSVALEVAEAGITVNALCPGYLLTTSLDLRTPSAERETSNDHVTFEVMQAAHPTKKFVTIDQIASLTAFLCSDDAASITGAILPVDGGWTSM